MGRLTDLQAKVDEVVQNTPLVDVHTHLYPPTFGKLLLRGVDQLLTYHYLVAETLRYLPGKTEDFWRLSTTEQADLVWRTLFVEKSPVSEACRGVLTTLQSLGLDTGSRNLTEYRAFFADLSPEEHVELVFKKTGLKALVMTNDPFDREEAVFWEQGMQKDERFLAALRLDELLNNWPEAADRLQADGYFVEPGLSGRTFSEIRRFLADWDKKMSPLYLAVSLPPSFCFPEESARGRIMEEAVLPFCRESGRPLALMIGVKKLVNPSLRVAGDSLGKAAMETMENLCRTYPDIKFLVTLLSRENQHELCVSARKFENLMPFGCWWFLNNPSLVQEITAMRLELLGFSFIPQHSDARVLDQLIYKWAHSRTIISRVLQEKYADLAASGWQLSKEEIRRDVEQLFYGNFYKLIGSTG